MHIPDPLRDLRPTAVTLVLPVNHDAYSVKLVARLQAVAGPAMFNNLGLDQTKTRHRMFFEYVGEGTACDAFIDMEEILVAAFGEENLSAYDIDIKPYKGPLHEEGSRQ